MFRQIHWLVAIYALQFGGCVPEFSTETSENKNENMDTGQRTVTMSNSSSTQATTDSTTTTTSDSTTTDSTTTTTSDSTTTTSTTTTSNETGVECVNEGHHCESGQSCCLAANGSDCSDTSCGSGYAEVDCYRSSECSGEVCCINYETSAYAVQCQASCGGTYELLACRTMDDCGLQSASCVNWYSDKGIEVGYCDNCCDATGDYGCTNETISDCVCLLDSYCCDWGWDDICVEEVTTFGCGTCAE